MSQVDERLQREQDAEIIKTLPNGEFLLQNLWGNFIEVNKVIEKATVEQTRAIARELHRQASEHDIS